MIYDDASEDSSHIFITCPTVAVSGRKAVFLLLFLLARGSAAADVVLQLRYQFSEKEPSYFADIMLSILNEGNHKIGKTLPLHKILRLLELKRL